MVSGVISRTLIPAAGRASALRLVGFVERISFWTAVVLPVLYIPGFLLVARGHLTSMAFVAVVGLNVAVAALGHRYEPGGDRPRGGAASTSAHDRSAGR